MIKNYINLIKPGIVIGNLTSAIAGFLVASRGCIDYFLLIYMSIGISLVIASSCIINNIIDRDIDAIMQRTKNRVLVQKKNFSIKNSIVYAIVLNITGFLFLIHTKRYLSVYLTVIGFFIYIIIYSLWMKRKFIYSTAVGSVSGSMPPITGYCMVTNTLDTGALIFLLIFSFWQISHSYSIIIFRLNDYRKACIPTFIVQKGVKLTRQHMIICIIGFYFTTMLLTIMGYASYIVLYIMSVINIVWLYTGIFEYQTINNDSIWAKKMFMLSVIVIILLNLLLSVDSFI